MYEVHISIVGLALFVERANLVLFPEGGHPDITAHGHHGHPMEAHRCCLGIPTAQHHVQRVPRQRFIFNNPRKTLGVGIGEDYSVYNLKAEEPQIKGFARDPQGVSVTPLDTSRPPERILCNMMALTPTVKRPLRGDALGGPSNIVIARLNVAHADINTKPTIMEEVEFDGVAKRVATIFNVVYRTEHPEPAIKLSNGGTIRLKNPLEDKWHLFIANVPLDEVLGVALDSASDLFHFDLMYNLFEVKHGDPRPIPKRKKKPKLSDPGFCGPPAT